MMQLRDAAGLREHARFRPNRPHVGNPNASVPGAMPSATQDRYLRGWGLDVIEGGEVQR